MGKNTQGILGNFSGKVGNVVGRIRNGMTIMSVYQRNVGNPRTTGQMAQRKKFALIVELCSALLAAIQRGFADEKGEGSAFSAAVSKNMGLALTGSYPNITVDLAKVVVSKGNLDNAYGMSATVDAGEVEVTWSDNSGIGNALATDKINIVVYDEERKTAFCDFDSLLRETRTASISLPSNWSGDKVYIYAFAKRADSMLSSNSLYLGEFTV